MLFFSAKPFAVQLVIFAAFFQLGQCLVQVGSQLAVLFEGNAVRLCFHLFANSLGKGGASLRQVIFNYRCVTDNSVSAAVFQL